MYSVTVAPGSEHWASYRGFWLLLGQNWRAKLISNWEFRFKGSEKRTFVQKKKLQAIFFFEKGKMADENDEIRENIFLDTEVAGNTITATSKIRNRAWFVTIFGLEKRSKTNYFGEVSEVDPMSKLHILMRNLKTQYFIYQKEKCPTTGREHVHAVLYFKNPRVWPKDEFSNFKPNIGKVRNLEKAIEYCSKEKTRIDGPWEEGEKPEQGKRSDLAAICEDLKTKNISELAEQYPEQIVKFGRGLRELKSHFYKHRSPKKPPEIYWFWGKTKCGKTETAHEFGETEEEVYVKDDTIWWDGYEQQKVVIIDDFDPDDWSFRQFLRVTDKYPLQVQHKGGYIKLNSPIIIITSEYHPDECWPAGNTRAQVVERLKEIREFKKRVE